MPSTRFRAFCPSGYKPQLLFAGRRPEYDSTCPRRQEGSSLNTDSAQLELSVDAGPGLDADELERLAGSLRTELLELDVQAVEPATRGAAPDGTRAVEALVVGALVVRLARSSESLAALARTVRSWLALRPEQRVRIELDGDVLELTGVSDDERDRLVDAWIERHGRR